MKKLIVEEVSDKHIGQTHQCLNAPVEGCYSLSDIGTVSFRNGKYLCDTGRFCTDFNGRKHYEASTIVTHILIWK
ncbi:hypothetical protein [Sphingobacterium sp. UBA6645]|uniref:hypothetical protein n=1 Tax=Sphingobacterium sp. UBA6645 TaxID=1947511 RepID=UPI0025CF9451|nr:hypothetical protein [Sphingobacterium sp. UBA6645]